MNNKYYQKQLYLAQVNQKDKIIGRVERWKAHKEGILHRGFTVILMYENKFLIQHRKHPAFDKFWDFTFSSHQIYENNNLQSDLEAINQSLNREWNLKKEDLDIAPIYKGSIYYKAKDPDSIYTEHEIDYIYLAILNKIPNPNFDFCYRFELVDSLEKITKLPVTYRMTPWVIEIIKSKILL